MRQHSTATVLFHQSVAEWLGLGPTDHKCLDLVRERGAMSASELSAITGLTSGAITGVVARLEQAGFLRRKPDPRDGRRQVLSPAPERAPDLAALFAPIQRDALELFDGFDDGQVTAIAEFLDRATRFVYRHSAMLRADAALSRPSPSAPTRRKLETRP